MSPEKLNPSKRAKAQSNASQERSGHMTLAELSQNRARVPEMLKEKAIIVFESRRADANLLGVLISPFQHVILESLGDLNDPEFKKFLAKRGKALFKKNYKEHNKSKLPS